MIVPYGLFLTQAFFGCDVVAGENFQLIQGLYVPFVLEEFNLKQYPSGGVIVNYNYTTKEIGAGVFGVMSHPVHDPFLLIGAVGHDFTSSVITLNLGGEKFIKVNDRFAYVLGMSFTVRSNYAGTEETRVTVKTTFKVAL